MAVYVITGGSSGIGAALGVELGRRGHAVGLLARREAKLAGVAERIEAAGGTAAWAGADVTDREGLRAAIVTIEEQLGPTDCMVANAGGADGQVPATSADADYARWVMDLNYHGVVNAFTAVLPAMVERGDGHLAAVSSVAGWRGVPGSSVYSAAKSALSTLLEAWAVELAADGIAVTTIHPGFVATPLIEGNDHPKPFQVEADHAGRVIAAGLERRRRRIDFPRRMAWFMSLVSAMPWWLYEPLARHLVPTGKTTE